jgi:polyphosphate kinase
MTTIESKPVMNPIAAPAPGSAPGSTIQDAGAQTVAPDDPARFLNREVLWLKFNERVLHQAMDDRVPLLERVRFLSIFAGNLDEFFMKRVGGLRRQVAAGVAATTYDGISAAQQLRMIREAVLPLIRRKAECFMGQVRPALAAAGVHLLEWDQLASAERTLAQQWYRRNVFPILTPLAVDPGHRFPFISNLSVSLAVMLRRPGEKDVLFARVKVPEVMPQWFQFGATRRFVRLRDIIEHNLADLFPGMEIMKVLPFRVTRNADVQDDQEGAEDLLEAMQQQLRERRFAPVVRLQVGVRANRRLLQFLTEELELRPDDIYETEGLINYRSLEEIANLAMPELRFPAWHPVVPPRLADDEGDLFAEIRRGDILVHHPYESFDASVERFISEAAGDPRVLCIKQALYRTSGDSSFVPELIRAAESGKQVAVLVEVRARFDEARNIAWARKLEDAGVHVTYGVVGLKTHTKIALVVRQEADGIRSYAHIGTGNYHARTARLYEDVGLLTADPAITEDLVGLFNYLTGRSRQRDYNRLFVAPVNMKKRFIELIENEARLAAAGGSASAGGPAAPAFSGAGAGPGAGPGAGRIIAKMNQLQDQEVIDALYRASQAGVSIDLIVRGFCCLRPGVPGLSHNIRVTSIIGRFLEHSRIFYFRSGQEDPLNGQFYIGSADWMYRNLHMRVEAACPIESRPLRQRLWTILQTCLADQRQCWDMMPDGTYIQRQPAAGAAAESTAHLGTQQRLMNLAQEMAREGGTRDDG